MLKNAGFTLIELMIVLAVVGVLSAISIPLYQGYIVKTQLSRALDELSSYRSVFEERVGSGQSLINRDIGYTRSSLTRDNGASDVASLNADGTGQLQVTMGGNSHPVLTGLILRLERSASGTWECVLDNAAVLSSWKSYYLPGGCRL